MTTYGTTYSLSLRFPICKMGWQCFLPRWVGVSITRADGIIQPLAQRLEDPRPRGTFGASCAAAGRTQSFKGPSQRPRLASTLQATELRGGPHALPCGPGPLASLSCR